MTPTGLIDSLQAASTSLGQASSSLASLSSSGTTSTPQDIYRGFVQDTSIGLSLVHIGEAFIVFGILLFAVFFIRRLSHKKGVVMGGTLTRNIACILTAIGVVIVFVGAYWGSDAVRIPRVFSNSNVSLAVWDSYKRQYIDPASGRTIDPSRALGTTSEGQSYTMLRAVWLDDQATFDKSWVWTQSNLQRPDKLFSWIYGRRSDGALGVLTEIDGQNSASDADSDIALALVFAYARWQDPQYLEDAQEIIRSIWETEVVMIADKPYLVANNVEKTVPKSTVVVNPSYLSPYAYRIFAKVDPAHPWGALVSSSYEIIQASLTTPLDKESSVDLPPDWIQVDRVTGALSAMTSPDHTTNYSYDAMRTPWRIALDWKWNADPRAKALLDQMSFLGSEWETEGLLYTSYGHDGSIRSHYEAPAMYGGSMGYFLVSDPQGGRAVYREKLLILFDPDTNTWRAPLSYYDANWVWFGMALYNDQLPDLSLSIGTLSISN
jgi:endoglucanase